MTAPEGSSSSVKTSAIDVSYSTSAACIRKPAVKEITPPILRNGGARPKKAKQKEFFAVAAFVRKAYCRDSLDTKDPTMVLDKRHLTAPYIYFFPAFVVSIVTSHQFLDLKMRSFLINSLVLLTPFASLTSACIYKRDAGSAVWSYTGETGPLLWHKLNETNSACALGKQQSPINVDSSIAVGNASLQYPAVAEFEIENNGHTIELTPNDSNLTAKLGGQDYKLLQFHFHTPSEHRLNKEHFPLEVHLVHENIKTGAVAVVGIFFDFMAAGTSDPFLDWIVLDNVTETTAATAHPISQAIYLSSIKTLVQRATIYTYSGSLTTPPCSEAVSWFVVKIPLAISPAKYKEFKNVMKFNSRYTQNDFHTPPNDNLIQEACKA